MNNNGSITIFEASRLTGKCQNTIHRYIKKGVLQSNTVSYNGKQVMTVNKSDIERIFNLTCNTGYDSGIQSGIQSNTPVIQSVITKDDIKEIMIDNLKDVVTTNKLQEFFETKQSELVKPMEQQALYKLGAVEKENIFLREKLEIIRQENELLQEQVKSLPNFQQEKDTHKAQVELLEKEKADLLSRAETIKKEKEEQVRKAEGLNQVLLDNANNIKELTKEKDNFQLALKEQEATIREKERALKDLEELHRAELEQAEKQAEKKQMEISEAWKKELELAKKPWWKFW